jgi:hypothetical protein
MLTALTGLMDSVGATGLTAAASRPGLLAAVDQHAAGVRDSLLAAGAAVGAAALAGYAEGVREAAGSHGWQPPVTPIDWSDPDWVLTRLLAVCALALDAGCAGADRPPPAGDRPAAA